MAEEQRANAEVSLIHDLRAILNYYKKDQHIVPLKRVELLRQKLALVQPEIAIKHINLVRVEGRNILHEAASLGDLQVFDCVLQPFSQAQRIKLLGSTNNSPSIYHQKSKSLCEEYIPLHFAILFNQTDIFKTAVGLITDHAALYELLSFSDSSQNTCLHWASIRGHVQIHKICTQTLPTETMERLLMMENCSGQTSLQVAVVENQTEVLNEIINLLPSTLLMEILNREDYAKRNAFHYLAKRPCTKDSFKALHEKLKIFEVSEVLVSVDAPNKRNPLHYAASSGNLTFIQHFLPLTHCDDLPSNLKCALEQKDHHGRNPLAVAIIHCHTEIAKAIINPLHTDLLKLLLSSADIAGGNAFHHIAKHCKVVDLLETIHDRFEMSDVMEAMMQVDITRSRNALHYAAFYGNSDFVRHLLPLSSFHVFSHRLLAAVSQLFEKKDVYGRTPLAVACLTNQSEVIEMFLRLTLITGAVQHLYEADGKDQTPISLSHNKDFAGLLYRYGAATIFFKKWLVGLTRMGIRQLSIPFDILSTGASHIPHHCMEDQSHNHDVQQYMTSLEHPYMLFVDCPSTVTKPDTSQQHHFVMDDETDLLDESESKGIWQDEGNDDRSICSESSTESIISRLCSLRGTIQQSLRNSLADKSWMHVTSTIASHSYQDQIESILMLATDFRESIVDYRDNVNDHTLKVTAAHFQSQDLHKRIKQISSLSTTLEGSASFLASCVTTKVPETLPSDKHGLLQLIKQAKPIQNNSSVLNGVQVEILFEQIPLLSVRVLSENAEVMTVQGIFEVESPPDPFEGLMVSLNDLNLTTDSQDVTVLAMLWENSRGEQHALFKYTAGAQLDLPEERSDSYQLTSRQLKNDKLHELIRKNSKHMLSQNMTSDRIEAWEKESPLFIVTSEVPDSACDDIADMLIQPEWMDNKEESGGRSVLLFRHPTETDTEIEVIEPASPAKVTTRRGRNTTTMQIGHDRHTANQHPQTPANAQPRMANPRINRTTRTLLEKKQSLVYRTLRQLHKMDGNLDDAVTAVIVTSTLDPKKVEPGIVLVASILRPNGNKDKNYLLKGDENAGVIISIHWLFSRPLKDLMRQAWETFCMQHPTFPKGKNISLFISHSDLHDYSTQHDNSDYQGHTLQKFIFPVIGDRLDTVIEPSAIVPEFKFETIRGSQYRISMKMTYGWERTTLCLSDAVISYETGLLRFEENEFRLNAGEILKIKQDRESKSTETQVTICVHNISSISKDHIRSLDIYSLVTAGGPSELDLPTRFLYHDPLHVWKCHTWTTNSPALAQLIEERWPGGVQDTANTVAKHVIHLHQPDRDLQIEIPLDHKDGDIGYAKDRTIPPLLLEVWSHINKPKAILNKLLDEEPDFNDLMRDRLRNRQQIREKIADCFDENQKPKSSQFPTTHFRLCRLAKPNQMGSASFTLVEQDVNNNLVQTESQQRNRHTTGDSHSTRNDAEAGINQGGCHSELTRSQCSENPLAGNDQTGASQLCQKSMQSDKTGTRPKQGARGDSLPSKHKLKKEAKGLPSIILHMENEDVSHFKFARPGVEPRIIGVDDVMVCVQAMPQ